jgi:hypothetical protein
VDVCDDAHRTFVMKKGNRSAKAGLGHSS